jgi:hypothetical protein
MTNKVKMFLIAFCLSCSAPHLAANSLTTPGKNLKAAELRRAETQAKSPEAHLQLAAYYTAQAERAKADLLDEETQMRHWAGVEGMADRTRIPNPYWSAKTLAAVYRARFERDTQLADDHRKTALSLQSH